MNAGRLVHWIRRLWIPVFLGVCVAFMAVKAEAFLAGFAAPSLRAPGFLFLAISMQLSVWWLLVSAWQLVHSARVGVQLSFQPALAQFALFSLGKYLPGKVWGLVARASEMSRKGVTTGSSVDATVYEQVTAIHAAMLLAAAMYAAIFPGLLSLASVLAGLMSVLFGPRVYAFALRVLASTLALLGHELKGIPTAIDDRTHAALLGRYVIAWIAHGLVLASIYSAISPEPHGVSIGGIGLLILANTAGMLAGFAAIFAPAGFGVREAALAAILTTGMSLQEAILVSVLMRAWTIAADVALGAMTLAYRKTRA